jgi:glycosyltransferase involved in cell wall biosynthesis
MEQEAKLMVELDISVVICTRNRPEALRGCLSSLALSTVLPLEVIVVDQSDNGRSAQVVLDCASLSPLALRYLQMEDTGHTKARNLGITTSRGHIVAFTDDDCTVSPTWIAELSAEFTYPEVNCVCGQTEPLSNHNRPKQALLSTIRHRRRRMLRGKHNPICIGRGNNFALRKTDLQMLGGFNESIGVGSRVYAGDDMDLLYRLLQSEGTIVCTPDAVAFHWQPDDLAIVLRKKRGYSISTAAILASRLWYGDRYAGVLLAAKIAYETVYLLCGGIIRGNRILTLVGWHSLLGSMSGIRHVANRQSCREVCPQRTPAEAHYSGSMDMERSDLNSTAISAAHYAEEQGNVQN